MFFQSRVVNWRTLSIEFVEPLIDFLYDNEVAALRNRNFSDVFICNMLVICDQYFVLNLSAVFEQMLIERLTIKKCAEIFEFACDYNRAALRQASLDFMVANIVRMLEYHCLEQLSLDVISQISARYRELLGDRLENSQSREEDHVWDAELESRVMDFEVNLYEHREKAAKRKKERKTSDSKQERIQLEKEAIEAMKNVSMEEDRSRSNSVSSESSLVLQEASKLSKEILAQAQSWTTVKDKKELRHKSTAAFLKANELLATEKKDDDVFVSLNKWSNRTNSLGSSNEDEDNDEFVGRTVVSLASFSPQKPLKLSQKQRKSLSKMNNSASNVDIESPPTSFENPWTSNSSDKTPDLQKRSPSFFDLKTNFPNPTFDTPRSSRSQNASPNGSFQDASPISSKSRDFTNILREEQQEKNYFQKLKNKSLALTLLEERAIDELKKFYNVENVYDERISVERIESLQPTMNFATWHHQK